jgi:hypothetical protein
MTLPAFISWLKPYGEGTVMVQESNVIAAAAAP